MSRYQVGPSQLKFTKAPTNATFTRGGINDAAGMRLWTMWFPDEEALTKRFTDHGFQAPAFKTIDSVRSALVAVSRSASRPTISRRAGPSIARSSVSTNCRR